MRLNACRVTKTSPGLTFRPAADETDPRVHVFVSFPSHLHMQTASPIAPRLHTPRQPIGPAGACVGRMGERARAGPAPSQTRCLGRSNTGPIAGCTVSTLTRRTSNTSAALCPTSPAGFTAEHKRESLNRAAPSWEGTYALRSLINTLHIPDYR